MRTFGTVRLVDALGKKQWAITCEPHVRVRLKRIFEKIPKGAHDTLTLSDTVEHASELLWFLDRYPMKVPQLNYLKARAREHQERATEIERILAAGYAPPAFAELALPPREYQRGPGAGVAPTEARRAA